MSQQWFYPVLRLFGYRVTKCESDHECLHVHVEPQPHKVCCSQCGSKEVIRRGEQERVLRNLPVGGIVSLLFVRVPRVACRSCGVVRQIRLGLAEERRSYTRAFARYVLELSRYMTIKDVAEHLGVSWDIVKNIQKQHLQRHYAKPDLRKVRHLAIDEICVGKIRRFATVVLDLDSGAILFVGKGKKAESLRPFWRRVVRAQAQIEAVAMDFSPAYQAAVRKQLPAATIVFDRFHVVKLLNQKLTQLRRQLYRQATTDLQKQALKGTRWLLLKNPENLDPARGEPKRLQTALRLNEPLATAYYLKEDLRQIWEQPNQTAARRKLLDWYHQAMQSGIRVLQDYARTLLKHAPGILAWYDYPISTGPLEGTNNKIKTLNRQHYGLRDSDFFTLKLYQLHEAKYALVG
jgi:transposase